MEKYLCHGCSQRMMKHYNAVVKLQKLSPIPSSSPTSANSSCSSTSSSGNSSVPSQPIALSPPPTIKQSAPLDVKSETFKKCSTFAKECQLEKPLCAMNIHDLDSKISPWPHKPGSIKPDGTARRVFETSVFMVPEPRDPEPGPRSPRISPPLDQDGQPKQGPESNTLNSNEGVQELNSDGTLITKCIHCCGECPPKPKLLKGILKHSRKYIITTTEVIQKTSEAGDAAEYTYQENVRVVMPMCKKKRSTMSKAKSNIIQEHIRWASNPPLIHNTYSENEYDRHAIDYIAKQLTPTIANFIKIELNEMKKTMEVHEDSRHMTQFYPVR